MMPVTDLKTSLTDQSSEPADREGRMSSLGIQRYRTRQQKLADRGTASDRDDYASVIRQSLLAVADRIAAAIDQDKGKRHADGRGQGPRSNLLLKVEAIEGDKEGYRGVTVAYITLSTLFNSLTKTTDKSKLASAIGAYLNNEANYRFIQDLNPALWQRLVRYAKERGSQRHQARFVLNTAHREGIEPVEWSFEERTLLGEWLLRILEDEQLITISTSTSGGYSTSEVILQDHIVAWLEEFREKADAGSLPMITPMLAPLTTPPRDWSTPYNGGYERIRYPLVKQGKADYRAADMSQVYAAVNLMQRTAWRIHPGMLKLVEHLWAEGTKVGKLPLGKVAAVPDRLPDEDWEQMAQDERKAWQLNLKDIHAHNRQAISDLATVDMVLAQARELQNEPAIYMPYQLDYRGRAYCQPLLNPQASGYIRAMLEFAHGKPVGAQGAMWLGIQAATLWDGEFRGKKLSKLSFQDRYDWACENTDMMRSCVDDPLGDRRWVQADKPFMFLRTAIDWIGSIDEGEDYVSHYPISLDGSCSGIQHYAAMLRDSVTASRVNLVPTELPGDIYSDVAEMLLPMLAADTPSDTADFWIQHGVTRKTVKKPVMTYGYSSREPGFTDWYEKEYVRPAIKAQGSTQASGPIARYLAKKTLAAVEQCLPSVATGMEWLIQCASLLAHEGKGVSWTAPSGFPVVQKVMTAPSIRVETRLGGEKLRVSVPGKSKKVNKEKQKSAISPNHTHSLDAAHLMLTVLQAREYGVTEFALIHDSFGTLPADTDMMFSAVREAFVDMYEAHDPLQHLYEQVYAALSEEGRKKLPMPPPKGDLDLTQILQSNYAFA